jgi:uncharacterized protein YcnI
MRLTVIALALAPALLPAAASAHVTLERGEAPANATYRAVLRIPHGCEGAATDAIRVRLPDGFIGAKPMPKPGWTLEIVRGPYDRPYQQFGETVTEGPREIVWSGGRLDDAWYDEFVVRGIVADLVAGTELPFKVTQSCGATAVAWDEIAAPGTDRDALDHPAPVLLVTAAGEAGSAVGTASVGPIRIAAAWTRATPPGADVAAGYMTITNTGSEPDTLLGGTAGFAREVAVHSMTVEDGVMRMSEIPGGLVVAPGATVTLTPGGDHVMFMGLSEAPKAGGAVRVTLRFERAGDVTVDFPVAPLGATTAPAGHAH